MSNSYDSVKDHVVCVPEAIESARVELVSFPGAPVFVGSALAKLFLDNEVIVVRSKMSGVVNRVVAENDQFVSGGDELFEIRNCHTVRGKKGKYVKPTYFVASAKTMHLTEEQKRKKALKKAKKPEGGFFKTKIKSVAKSKPKASKSRSFAL